MNICNIGIIESFLVGRFHKCRKFCSSMSTAQEVMKEHLRYPDLALRQFFGLFSWFLSSVWDPDPPDPDFFVPKDRDALNMMVLMNSCWNFEYFTLLKFENLFVGSKVVIFSQKWPKFQIKTKKGKQIYAVVLNTRTLNAYNFWPDGPIFKLQKVKWSKCQNLSKGSGSGSAKTEGPGSLIQATDMLLSYYTMPVYWYSKQIIK